MPIQIFTQACRETLRSKTMELISKFLSRFWFLLAFGLYALVFILPIPSQVKFEGVQVMDEAIILAGCALIFLAFKKTGWIWKTIALTVTLSIFTLPLLRVWENAESNYNLVLGLLPWSDANGYYSDAITLLQGGLFSTFSGHRPFFSSFLAVLLNLSHESILISIVVLTIINGLAVFLFAREIQENFGPFAGASLILLLQVFYRQFAGVLLTEQLGLPLGLIALSSLIHAVRKKNKWSFSSGLFLLTLALFTRAGAFFVLPAILLVGIILFKENGRFSPKNSLLLCLALLAGWGLNFALGRLVSTPGTASMGNFSYTLYGQAMGGKGWTQVFLDHPELSQLPDAEQAQAIYRLALNEIWRHPAGLATGFFNAWKDFFVPSPFAGFGFLQPGDKYSSPVIQVILTIFLLIGLFQSWRHRDQGLHLLLLALSAGILLSIPFAPPSESALMRVYAATISIPILLACLGLLALIQKPAIVSTSNLAWEPGNGWILTGAGLLLVFTTLAGAVFLRATAHSGAPAVVNCPNGSIPLQVRLSSGSFITIATNESGTQTHLPNISARDFRQSLRAFPGVYSGFSRNLIENITPPILFTFTRNLLTGDFFWLIAPPELAVSAGKTISACGEAAGQGFSVIYITPVHYRLSH